LMIPAFSEAISASVSPRKSMWSIETQCNLCDSVRRSS
jgi:hypothetical protein